jgi:glycosyltransferase involved in cell wall biosynthesis
VRPLSVLYFTNEFTRGGAEEHILTLLRGLDRALFRPSLVCSPGLAGLLKADLPVDVEVVPLSVRHPWQVGAALKLARIIRERRVDVLHSHLFYSSLFASPLGWLCRVPAVVETPHVRELWRQGWLKSRYGIDRLAGRFVDFYIAVSEANARYLVKQKGLPARKIVVILNGCDIEQFEPDRAPSPDLRERLGFGPSDPVLMVIGRLEPQKGHRVLLEAMTAVLGRFPQARLVCVGDGALREALEHHARELGLTHTVRFVGRQSNMRDWLALAELTVLPSFYEGLPLVAIESLAAGRPVVATEVDGTPEVVVDGRTGLLVPPNDSGRLAEAICHLLGHEELRHRLGRAGRDWVRERFTHERQVRETQNLYLRALDRSPAPCSWPQPGLDPEGR